ncbi:mRNA turnover protein 4 [Orchesella cincta]|uniref:Ribosome assembly factor mrt4 n=1 Tax=Orchesella cincta TaxID=48709 RepID=A0A1D2M8D3_ORCCI|nr:mRNA turnover protein 4 [Orchesella cincta]
MPKSKRDKKVSLTKTAKHGMEWKKKLVKDVQEAAQEYNSIYVFRVNNMRISGLNELRKKFRDSKMFLGKNKVVALALGKDAQSEMLQDVHKISERLQGECGLLFTSRQESEVMEAFESFCELDYARGGAHATKTVELEEGPLEQFAHSLEPHLRSLGLPTSLKKGVVTLIKDYKVCKKGQVLTPEQARILKLLDIKMAEFRVVVDSVWTKPDDFKVLLKLDSSMVEDEEEVDEDQEETIVEDEEMDDDDNDGESDE